MWFTAVGQAVVRVERAGLDGQVVAISMQSETVARCVLDKPDCLLICDNISDYLSREMLNRAIYGSWRNRISLMRPNGNSPQSLHAARYRAEKGIATTDTWQRHHQARMMQLRRQTRPAPSVMKLCLHHYRLHRRHTSRAYCPYKSIQSGETCPIENPPDFKHMIHLILAHEAVDVEN